MNASIEQTSAQEAKLLVETLRGKVARLQAEVGEKGADARGSFPRRPEKFRAYENAKKDWQAAITELKAAKLKLARLEGSTGGDPKWALLREAWHVLNEIDERGVDIGERGHALLEEIEFHVPAAKLQEDIERAAPLACDATKTGGTP